jgi:hypothetical protein
MVCPVCLKEKIRRTLTDFLMAQKVCLICEKEMKRPLDIKEIPFYQGMLKLIYTHQRTPGLEQKLFLHELKHSNVTYIKDPFKEMTEAMYLNIVLNREGIIFLYHFLTLDNLEILDTYQSLNVIEFNHQGMV